MAALAASSMARARAPWQPDADLGFFHDSRADVLAHFKRLGVISPVLPPGFTQREDLKAMLEAKVSDALRQAGFEVVGSEDYKAALDRFIAQLGGIYDPRTGALKRAQSSAADENARREFVDKDHLDGFVYLSLRETQASYAAGIARWDWVKERSSGPPIGPTLSGILNYNFKATHTGTLPAYSLQLQIANAGNQVVFGRQAGIQLASYLTDLHPEAGGMFRAVPPQNLFRDEKRIDRAIQIDTLGLLHSAEEIAAGAKDPSINADLIKDLPPLPEGVFPHPEAPLKVPRDEILARTHRVVLTELSHPGLSVPPEAAARYLKLIREELKPLRWEIIESDQVFAALAAALGSSAGLYEPMTGAADTARLAALRRSIYTHLGVDPSPDAILWVQLVPTVAQYHQRFPTAVARWDGAVQSVGSWRNYICPPGSFARPASGEASEPCPCVWSCAIPMMCCCTRGVVVCSCCRCCKALSW
jgi:hypothetical protein